MSRAWWAKREKKKVYWNQPHVHFRKETFCRRSGQLLEEINKSKLSQFLIEKFEYEFSNFLFFLCTYSLMHIDSFTDERWLWVHIISSASSTSGNVYDFCIFEALNERFCNAEKQFLSKFRRATNVNSIFDYTVLNLILENYCWGESRKSRKSRKSHNHIDIQKSLSSYLFTDDKSFES